MQSFRQIGAGLLLGVVSVVIVLGGLALSLTQGGMAPVAAPSGSPDENTPPGEIATSFPTLPLLIFTDTPRGPDFTATVSITPPPTLTNCPPPDGWLPIIIQSFDTLDSLAQVYRTTVNLLRDNNCLLNDQLIAGSILYVPPQPTSTIIPCGAPQGWASYTVVAGDTLYRISLLYRVTVSALMQANCLNTSVIRAGQVLKVPNVPTSTGPAPADTPTPTLTPVLIVSPTVTVSATVTEHPALTPTPSPSAPTETMTEAPSPTTTPTETPAPSRTPTPES